MHALIQITYRDVLQEFLRSRVKAYHNSCGAARPTLQTYKFQKQQISPRSRFSIYTLFVHIRIEKIQLFCRKLQTFVLTQQLYGPLGSSQCRERVWDTVWLLTLKPAEGTTQCPAPARLCLLLTQLISHISTEIDPQRRRPEPGAGWFSFEQF